jgi:hypothetical protein
MFTDKIDLKDFKQDRSIKTAAPRPGHQRTARSGSQSLREAYFAQRPD